MESACRITAFALASLLTIPLVGWAADGNVLDGVKLGALERQIHLPRGAYRLSEYWRQYADYRMGKDGPRIPFERQLPARRRLIVGMFLHGGISLEGHPAPRIEIVPFDRLPQPPIDSGCGAVFVAYDVQARRMVGTWCYFRA